MNFTKLKIRVNRQIAVKKRLKVVCLWYLIFLMMSGSKAFAYSRFSIFRASNRSIQPFFEKPLECGGLSIGPIIEKTDSAVFTRSQIAFSRSAAMANRHFNRQHHPTPIRNLGLDHANCLKNK